MCVNHPSSSCDRTDKCSVGSNLTHLALAARHPRFWCWQHTHALSHRPKHPHWSAFWAPSQPQIGHCGPLPSLRYVYLLSIWCWQHTHALSVGSNTPTRSELPAQTRTERWQQDLHALSVGSTLMRRVLAATHPRVQSCLRILVYLVIYDSG